MIRWFLLKESLGLALGFYWIIVVRVWIWGFNRFYRVLTREIPINDKKKKVKATLHTIKKIGKENIQEACSNNQHKDEWADMIFWHYPHKEELSDFYSFVSSEKIKSGINKFQTFYSIIYPFQSVFGCLLELYEMKFSYTVLRGGISAVYLSQ